MNVVVSIIESPVRIPSLNGEGKDEEYLIWDGITVKESFPKTHESAGYTLELVKDSPTYEEVSSIESELLSLLYIFSYCWVFAGGSHFKIHEKKEINTPYYRSNAEDVRDELLRQEGLKHVSASFDMAYEVGCTYQEAPLRKAIDIAKECRASPYFLNYLHTTIMRQ